MVIADIFQLDVVDGFETFAIGKDFLAKFLLELWPD